MREILFRGKQEDNGEWVCGAFCPKSCDLPFGPMFDRPSIIKLENPCSGYWADVIPETVGQYTGLTDKNGKKIFEGDIIDNHDFNAEDGGYGVVEYNDGAFEINGNGISSTFHENYWGKECEVVGNIYDDPELLGGADNGK